MVEPSFVRLYLAKNCEDSRQDIYVDTCPFVEHQLNGIRYLHRAWKKKKPGVIINDPSGYGKRVQTVLFLSAVVPTLAKPVLILCREGSELQWMNYFQEWTKISDDVSIEQSNPFAKKKVIISTTYAAVAFAKREWSLLVVDHDLISKDIQKSRLKADLTVWITSSPIKEDLAKFSSFYSWVYPKAKFTAEKFKINNKDLNYVLTKTAMLDAFLEDIVLRRDWGVTPFPKSQISNLDNTIDRSKSDPKITKKNKDATGTKIKRSKRKSVETATENVANKVARTTKIKNTAEINSEVFDIGNFDSDKSIKAIQNATVHLAENINPGDISDQSDEDDFTLLSCKRKKNNVLWDSEDENEHVNRTSTSQKDENQGNKENNTQLDASGEKLLRWDSDTDSENYRNDHVNDIPTTNFSSKMGKPEESAKPNRNAEVYDVNEEPENSGSLINNENLIKSLHPNDIDNEIIDEINPVKNISEDLFSTDFTTNNRNAEVYDVNEELENSGSLINNDNLIKSLHPNDIDNENIDKINPVKNISEDLFSTDFTTNNEINGVVKKVIYETESADNKLPSNPNDLKFKKIVYETESSENKLPTSSNNANVKEIENGLPENLKHVELIENTNIPVNAKLSSFEAKMKELEERTMKKYKGSFLDSIF